MDIPGKKYAFDSTTIPLCLATFPWAKFRRKKGGVKAHELYRIHLTESFFVLRAKTNLKYKIVKWKRRMPKNVLTDAKQLSALDVANLYKKRWLVELFFKWLNYHLLSRGYCPT